MGHCHQNLFRQYRKQRRAVVGDIPMPLIDIGIEKVSTLIHKETNGCDDAFQDAWVAVLERKAQTQEDIKILAKQSYKNHRHRVLAQEHTEASLDKPFDNTNSRSRYSTSNMYEVLPAQPLEPFDEGGLIEETIQAIKEKQRVSSTNRCIGRLRFTDIPCRYCGSDFVIKYGHQKKRQYYWCLVCERKFRDTTAPYYMKYEHAPLIYCLDLLAQGATFAMAKEILSEQYKVSPSTATISRWKSRCRQKILGE